MKIREIKAKSILSKSQVYDYALNPYVGCAHSCACCYARFMKRFTGHREMWGGRYAQGVRRPCADRQAELPLRRPHLQEEQDGWAMEDSFFKQMGETLNTGFDKEGIPCQVLF